eukprot:Hpha_TRINITY_DN15562_c1_g1::TRINITY_DN15562_c1_g1_i1::g.103798::m.103798
MASIQLVKAYDLDEKKARFEDQYGLVDVNIGGQTVNVFDTHAETIWFATAQSAPDETYPVTTGDKGEAILVHGSQHLVPPNPARAGKIASGQGPVYRILEEEIVDDVPQGYISTNEAELPAIDYLEGLEDDVKPGKPRVAGSASGRGGELFKLLKTSGSNVVEQAHSASGQVVHVFNKRGVAQRVATQHFKKSKRKDNLAKWADASLRGDFSESGYRINFENGDCGWHVPGWEEQVNDASGLGLTFEGNSVKNVKAGSPAASVGIHHETPWAHLAPEGSEFVRELKQTIRFTEIKWSTNPDQMEDQYQRMEFSEASLNQVLSQLRGSPATLVLWRAPIANESVVREALDRLAQSIRGKQVEALQRQAQEEGWFVRVEPLPLTAWPPGESDEGRQGLGPFPADWPGYHMEDKDGNPVQWDPERHAEPVDEDYYGREFVKQYSYVLARGSKKGPSGPSGDKWIGLAGLYAALYGYNSQSKNATELEELFPDRNVDTRRAYIAGLQSQIPAGYAKADEEKTFKAKLLRYAYFLGMNNPNRKPDDMVPHTDRLRAAYKDGKRAVCVGITEEIWKQKLSGGSDSERDIYKALAVPVDFVNLGRVGEDQESRAASNFLLRKVWEQGVDDAWEGRKHGELTEWTAVRRVPDAEESGLGSVVEAFRRGADAAKKGSEYLSDSTLRIAGIHDAKFSEQPMTDRLDRMESDGAVDRLRESGVTLEADGHFSDEVDQQADNDQFREQARRLAFKDGLEQAWKAVVEGKEAPKPEERYPFTSEELLKAFEDGATQRARDEKKKAVEKVAEEEAEEEETCCTWTLWALQPCYVPCVMCYDACCPMCTRNDDTGLCECCGTTCGDWLLILTCFMFWYTFMGFWYWALIEVLLAVAEPQRPW